MFDFMILATPRSGSHMLATALDSHPEIQMVIELQQYFPGHSQTKPLPRKTKPIMGALIHVNAFDGIPPEWRADKLLVLTRRDNARLKSGELMAQTNQGHFYQPETITLNRDNLVSAPSAAELACVGPRVNAQLQRHLAGPERKMMLTYEQLTQDIHIDVIPEPFSSDICSFIGARSMLLHPKVHKPTVIYEN